MKIQIKNFLGSLPYKEVVIAFISAFLGWWLNIYISQPRIEYATGEYYSKLEDKSSIGTVYLINTGKKLDTNITFFLDDPIDPQDVHISDWNYGFSSEKFNNKTRIKIDQLRPGDEADITFKTITNKDTFTATSFVSDNTNFKEIKARTEWWEFSPVQIVIIILGVLFSLILGVFIEAHYYFRKRGR